MYLLNAETPQPTPREAVGTAPLPVTKKNFLSLFLRLHPRVDPLYSPRTRHREDEEEGAQDFLLVLLVLVLLVLLFFFFFLLLLLLLLLLSPSSSIFPLPAS